MGQVNTPTYYFKRLSEEDDVQSFHCGSDPWQTEVSDFFKDDALTQQVQGLNVTWLCYSDTHELKGFVSLVASSIRFGYSDEMRANDLEQVDYEHFPCVLLGQFGVELDAQGQGRGKFMLSWVIGMVTELDIGVRYLTVHVERDNSTGFGFWEKQGFGISKIIREHDTLIYMAYDLYSTPQ